MKCLIKLSVNAIVAVVSKIQFAEGKTIKTTYCFVIKLFNIVIYCLCRKYYIYKIFISVDMFFIKYIQLRRYICIK